MSHESFTSYETAWCPGCGNFPILDTMTKVLNERDLSPHKVVLVGGIGQAAKTNQYVNANGFSGLHGRSLPPAVAIKMVNDDLTVIVNTGDGDSYGEGGNHFLHNIRRNVDITHFVHDNQIYGLTKGQTSPTSDSCSNIQKGGSCNRIIPFNPLLVAISAGASFVARSFSGNKEHLAKMMHAALDHKGYALVDILQPCVTFNKRNTYAYYKERTEELGEDYDSSDKLKAIELLLDPDEDKIPIGILYQTKSVTYHERYKDLYREKKIFDGKRDPDLVKKLIQSYI